MAGPLPVTSTRNAGGSALATIAPPATGGNQATATPTRQIIPARIVVSLVNGARRLFQLGSRTPGNVTGSLEKTEARLFTRRVRAVKSLRHVDTKRLSSSRRLQSRCV